MRLIQVKPWPQQEAKEEVEAIEDMAEEEEEKTPVNHSNLPCNQKMYKTEDSIITNRLQTER